MIPMHIMHTLTCVSGTWTFPFHEWFQIAITRIQQQPQMTWWLLKWRGENQNGLYFFLTRITCIYWTRKNNKGNVSKCMGGCMCMWSIFLDEYIGTHKYSSRLMYIDSMPTCWRNCFSLEFPIPMLICQVRMVRYLPYSYSHSLTSVNNGESLHLHIVDQIMSSKGTNHAVCYTRERICMCPHLQSTDK